MFFFFILHFCVGYWFSVCAEGNMWVVGEEIALGDTTMIPNAVHRKCMGLLENFFKPLNFETFFFFFKSVSLSFIALHLRGVCQSQIYYESC